MKIYTRTGDKGYTSLYGGKRLPKNHLRVASYGTIDELNSMLGVTLSKIQEKNIISFLIHVQQDLFLIGSQLAGAGTNLENIEKRVADMEKFIDEISNVIPPLKNFILPSGTESSSFLFLSRALTRRAEREIVALSLKEKVNKSIIVYLNRLSDLLFVLARFLNYKSGIKEKIWRSSG
jgi:cob(I)alamin adenosyltransferase